MRKGVLVTDHALVRYLHRTGRIDMEALRDSFQTPEVIAAAETLQACKIPFDGVRLVVRDGVIVTVVDK